MQEIIKNFIERDNGLLLLTMPTGTAKTYNYLKFISENYKDHKYRKTKFIVITSLKKNLSYGELGEMFRRRGEAQIPYKIQEKEEYKRTRTLLNMYSNPHLDKVSRENLRNTVVEQIANIYEPKFRKIAIKELKEYRKLLKAKYKRKVSDKDVLKHIKKDENYKWIGELYPAMYTLEKRILFMSVDKFVKGNVTLIQPAYTFYNSDFIDKAVIFIDEFDSTKDRIMNCIIESSCRGKIDLIRVTKEIYAQLHARIDDTDSHFPEILNKSIIINMLERFQYTYDKFNMKYSFKTEMDDIEDSRNFFFSDANILSITPDTTKSRRKKDKRLNLITDHAHKQNKIVCQEKTNGDSYYLKDLIANLQRSLNYFIGGCRLMASDYRDKESQHRKPYEDEFTYENAVRSVLAEFYLSKEITEYVYNQIMTRPGQKRKTKGAAKIEPNEFSFYTKGFRYFDFIDSADHHMQSSISMTDIRVSAEQILVCMAKRAKVLGVSATATIDSVLCNYSLDYLKRALAGDFYEISNDSRKRMDAHFQSLICNYINTAIHTEVVSCECGINLEGIIKDKELRTIYEEKMEVLVQKYKGAYCEYAKKRLIKLLSVLHDAVVNPEIGSFLCLTNNLVKDNSVYNLDFIRDVVDTIIDENSLPYKAEDLLACISSNDYAAQYENIRLRLSAGEKIIILSSYGTIGAGQNLQYRIPEGCGTVKINDFVYGNNEKDIDGIYMEYPTNQVVNINSGALSESDLLKYIIQTESLMENGEMSRSDGENNLKKAFKVFYGGGVRSFSKNPPCQSFNAAIIRVLIQAVGRICRTSNKNRNIYVLVDEEIMEKCDFSYVEDWHLNPEFRSIIELSKKYPLREPVMDEKERLENMAENKSLYIINKLFTIFRGEWTQEDIVFWEELREVVMKHPTISKKEMDLIPEWAELFCQAHEPISAYSYEQEGDYGKSIKIKFDDSLKQKVSEEDARLKELFNIDGLQAYFEQRGYATSFRKNQYLIPPVIFNNIYKGALGEKVGAFILEKYTTVKLNSLCREEHERFDFVTDSGTYVDFKHWKNTMKADADEGRKYILQKLEKCSGDKVVLINLMHDADADIHVSADRRIVEVPYLYRTDKHAVDMDMINKIIGGFYLA